MKEKNWDSDSEVELMYHGSKQVSDEILNPGLSDTVLYLLNNLPCF